MKTNNFIISGIFFMQLLSACGTSKHNDFSTIGDRYFGEEPLGLNL